jgi:hypothetical protein
LDHGKWYLSKLAPKRYGDRLELAGEVKRSLDEEELNAAIAAKLAAMGGQ